eukprot:CAMPEP_0172643966 /NCGR_PEP_ID=MMETSP1068-20121228/238962_1 /TAXON_ID=35684 /ORGANISM="Pseudopedinella elastica, Strain CCMP716" /LENGTH=107 /DNA_ID=CAMNT_0013458143 /DNA_START=9 /DNA_END=332 /DNA_ORIENTATION=-
MAQFVGVGGSHTILLKQEGKAKTFTSHPTFDSAVDAIISMYEAKLKELNPTLPHIQYDIGDLNAYIDTMTDLTAMVLDQSTCQYQGVSKAKVKAGILANLTKKAGLK